MKSLPLILFAAMGCGACSGVRCDGNDVKSVAQCHAILDFRGGEKVVLRSVRKFRNGETSVIDASRQDEYALKFREKLLESDCYEVCFSPSPARLGGGGCYYIEEKSLELLAKYLSV